MTCTAGVLAQVGVPLRNSSAACPATAGAGCAVAAGIATGAGVGAGLGAANQAVNEKDHSAKCYAKAAGEGGLEGAAAGVPGGVAGRGASAVGRFAKGGREIAQKSKGPGGGSDCQMAPFGNRTGHPTGGFPHYHRRGPGGIKRHRPWDKGPGGFRGRF